MDNATTTRVTTGTATLHAQRAAQVIEGEQQAAIFFDRIKGGMAQPDELAVIVAYLHGELLHGFCRLVQKALEARHG